MIDYSSWKTQTCKITNLNLDPKNPRLPEAQETATQRQLIEALVEHEKVLDLAKEIAERGFFPHEQLLVVEENGKKYVAEGNRRLAALKILQMPDLAPIKHQTKIKKIASGTNLSALEKVAVVIAPSRTSAAQIIMSKHTSSQVKSWSPVMQANYFKQLLDAGTTVKKLSEEYSIPVNEIYDSLQLLTMYRVACALELPSHVAEKVKDNREFTMTTVQRLYTNPDVQKTLGIEFNAKKELVGKINQDEFKKGYSKIISDVATKKIDSRKVNTAADIKAYLDTFKDTHKPNLKKKGRFDAPSLIDGAQGNSLPEDAALPEKKTRIERNSSSVIPRGCKCTSRDKRVNAVFTELKKIKLETHPNTCGVMLRVLLELALNSYLKTKKLSEPLKTHFSSKDAKKNRPDWSPTLSQMLSFLINQGKDHGITVSSDAHKAISRILQDENIISIDTLDQYVHNVKYQPTESEIRKFWNSLEEVFTIILNP